MSVHTCHAIGCETAVPPKLFMCRDHWAMVPKKLQTKVWEHYRLGQEIDKVVTMEYLYWTSRAKRFVARKEKVMVPPKIEQFIAKFEQCKFEDQIIK